MNDFLSICYFRSYLMSVKLRYQCEYNLHVSVFVLNLSYGKFHDKISTKVRQMLDFALIVID